MWEVLGPEPCWDGPSKRHGHRPITAHEPVRASLTRLADLPSWTLALNLLGGQAPSSVRLKKLFGTVESNEGAPDSEILSFSPSSSSYTRLSQSLNLAGRFLHPPKMLTAR